MKASARPAVAAWVVVAERETVRKHSSDESAVRVRMYDIQVDSRGTWETQSLAEPAGDGNIPSPEFARELMGEHPESASESVRAS